MYKDIYNLILSFINPNEYLYKMPMKHLRILRALNMSMENFNDWYFKYIYNSVITLKSVFGDEFELDFLDPVIDIDFILGRYSFY